jgi:hypothetical protein
MLERFLQNETAVRIISIEDAKMPKFTDDDFNTISVIKTVI